MLPRPPSPNPPYPPPYNPSVSAHYDRKQKQRSIMGITAGAEDVKYQAKYRELKKKVKEIESDNDRLYFKLLLAKKNIRRMNLERAILYERLAAVPPTPGRQTHELPTEQDPVFHPQPPAPPEHARVIDPNDREVSEYLRAHPNARLKTGPDGRVVAIEDTPIVDSRGIAVLSGPPPPHGIPLVHGFRHDSGPGYDPARQLPPPPPMVPFLQHSQEAPHESAPPNDHQAHGYPYPQAPPPPSHQANSHSSSSHQSRSSSARPDLDAVSVGNPRIDASSGSYSVHSRSPNIPGEPQAGHRARRHEAQDHPHSHVQQLPPPPIQIPQQSDASSPPIVSPSAHSHSSRLHNHQRIGPGAHIHRERDERDWEIQQELQYQRELEREREEQRAIELRRRLEIEEREEEALWAQEEARVRARALSRSGSPGLAPRNGGSRDASRPTSGQAHDPDRPSRAYAPHVSNLLGIERDPRYNGDEHGLGPSSRDGALAADGPQGSGLESRRRSRDEMEIDERYESEPRAVIEGGAASRGTANASGNRGAKRSHPDEDDDAGNPAAGQADDLPDERMEEDA